MQINGSSLSLAEYYAELIKLRNQTASANKSNAAELFGKADSDGDGGVNASEFAAMFSQAQSSAASEAGAGSEAAAAAEAVAETDSTAALDGKLPPSSQIAAEELEELFAGADQDGDGVLSYEEFAALSEQMRPPPPPQAGHPFGDSGNLLSMLQSSSSYANVLGLGNEASSSTSMFTELLKTLGGGGSANTSDYSKYIQSMVKGAYGV